MTATCRLIVVFLATAAAAAGEEKRLSPDDFRALVTSTRTDDTSLWIAGLAYHGGSLWVTTSLGLLEVRGQELVAATHWPGAEGLEGPWVDRYLDNLWVFHEEPYTLRILWALRLADHYPGLRLEIAATDADPAMLARARCAVYKRGSLRELPEDWIATAFDRAERGYRLRDEFRSGIRFLRQDIRQRMPAGPFDLVLCRNLAFTYFDAAEQRRVAARIARRMAGGGILLVGARERLPEDASGFREENAVAGAYRCLGPLERKSD